MVITSLFRHSNFTDSCRVRQHATQGRNDPVLMDLVQKTTDRRLQQMIHLVDDLLDVACINRDKIALNGDKARPSHVVDNGSRTAALGRF